MRLHVDNEFQQVKMKDLNDENSAEMLIATEQKIRELRTRISKIKNQKLKISPAKIMESSTLNINLMKTRKYGLSPEEIVRRALFG